MADPSVDARRQRMLERNREEGRLEAIAEFYGDIYEYNPNRLVAPLYDEILFEEVMQNHPDICDDDFRGTPPWMRRI